MTAQFENTVLDNGLTAMHTNVTHITICAAEPTSYAIATGSGLLGYNSFGAGNAFSTPVSSSTSLRTLNSTAVSAGTITTSGSAQWWAAVDESNSVLYAHGSLSAAQSVTATNTFSLAAFAVQIPQHA